MAEIKYIPVKKLWQHPDNPRKDLGDVTELAESIKVNGVLQNLTVVPLIGEITKKWDGESYRVIIGHRRLAAAKLAGLEELPCVVVEMSEREQLSTMLTENMQRSDLTVYEQAQGFQMMLDMGDTVEDIAEKSGFSATTVRRRVKLLELDKDKFKKSEERGVSLFEYMELDKLKSPERKNEMLDFIGTDNFKYKLKQAIDEILEEMENREAETNKLKEQVAQLTAELNQARADLQKEQSSKPEIAAPIAVAPASAQNDRHSSESFELVLSKAKGAYEEIVSAADTRAAEIINKANQDAASIRSDAQTKIADLTAQLAALRKQTAEYYDSLKKITDAQTASMEQIKRLL